MTHLIRIAGPAAASVIAIALLAIVNRQSSFVEGFVGGAVQWLLTAIVIAGLLASGAAVGRLWSAHSRFRAIAFAAPLSAALAAAATFLFAQTYSPEGSDAAGFIGLVALVGAPIAVALSIVAAAGSTAPPPGPRGVA